MATVVRHRNQVAARMLQKMTSRLMRSRTGTTIKTQRMISEVMYQEESSLRRRDFNGGGEDVPFCVFFGSRSLFLFCITSRSNSKEASCFS